MIVAEVIERITTLNDHTIIVMSHGAYYARADYNEKEKKYELRPMKEYKNFLLAIKAMAVVNIFVGSYIIILEV